MKTANFFGQTNAMLSKAEMGRLHGGAGNCAVAVEIRMTENGPEEVYRCGVTEAQAKSEGKSYCCGSCATSLC